MKSKLLNKDAYEAICRNCKHGRLSPEGDTVLCVKKGIVDPDGSCRRYSYDPLKRVPRKMPAVREANPEDFDLSIDIDLPEKPRNEIPAVAEEIIAAVEEEIPEIAEEPSEIFDESPEIPEDTPDEAEEQESEESGNPAEEPEESEESECTEDESDETDEKAEGNWSKTSIFDISDEMETDL